MDIELARAKRWSRASDYASERKDIVRREHIVFAEIARYEGEEHAHHAQVSLEDLQEFLRMPERTIRRALQGLEEKKLLETILKPTRGNAGVWRLCYEKEELKAAVIKHSRLKFQSWREMREAQK